MAVAAVVAGGVYIVRTPGWLVNGGSSEIPQSLLDQLQPAPERLGDLVAAGADPLDVQAIDSTALTTALQAVIADAPGHMTIAASSLGDDALLFDYEADTPMIPASTTKLLTALASAHVVGADTRFSTSVDLDASTLTLVGGGDPYLMSTSTSYAYASTVTPATLADLASRTITALLERGITQVELAYDDTVFSGASWHDDWDLADRTWVAPVTGLAVDEGAGCPDLDSLSGCAATQFATLLKEGGIAVNGDPRPAATAGERIAEVQSMRVARIVREVLLHSDNYAAEVMLRHVAIASGKPATFAGGVEGLVAALGEIGVNTVGLSLTDGSGMSANNRITARTLVSVIEHAANDPELEMVLEGLPVSAATGTLLSRFGSDDAAIARGDVRAKTGSLNSVSTLAGYAITQDRGLVAFAVMGNDLADDRDPRPWIDQIAAAIAGCDCAVA